MKNIFTLLFCFIVSLALGQQNDSEDGSPQEIFQLVEQMPEYPGGQKGLLDFLSLINYPEEARQNNIEGTVYVRFVIDKEGNVTNLELARGADKLLNNAAIEHLKHMARWKPGYQKGKPVLVQYVVPIRFKLNDPVVGSKQSNKTSELESGTKKNTSKTYNPSGEPDFIEKAQLITLPEQDTAKAKTFYSQGREFFDNQKMKQAVEKFEQAYLLNKDDLVNIYFMGLSKANLGNYYGACKCWEHIKPIDPDMVTNVLIQYCK